MALALTIIAQILHQYFPEGTDLKVLGLEDLEHGAQNLYARPRKMFD